jgi:hypothetical protein
MSTMPYYPDGLAVAPGPPGVRQVEYDLGVFQGLA